MAKIIKDGKGIGIVTAGRDGWVKLWQVTNESINEVGSYKEHEGFVNSVAYIPTIPDYTEGKFILFLIFAINSCFRCYYERWN